MFGCFGLFRPQRCLRTPPALKGSQPAMQGDEMILNIKEQDADLQIPGQARNEELFVLIIFNCRDRARPVSTQHNKKPQPEQ